MRLKSQKRVNYIPQKISLCHLIHFIYIYNFAGGGTPTLLFPACCSLDALLEMIYIGIVNVFYTMLEKTMSCGIWGKEYFLKITYCVSKSSTISVTRPLLTQVLQNNTYST